MKRFAVCLFIIVFISFGVSFFVKAEEKVPVIKPIDELYINTDMMTDNAVTKLNFFKKNIKVVYKKTNYELPPLG